MKIGYNKLYKLICEAVKKEIDKYDFLENTDMATYKHRLHLINRMYFQKSGFSFLSLLQKFIEHPPLGKFKGNEELLKIVDEIWQRCNDVYKYVRVGERVPFGKLELLKELYYIIEEIQQQRGEFYSDNFIKVKHKFKYVYNIIDEYVTTIENYKVKS